MTLWVNVLKKPLEKRENSDRKGIVMFKQVVRTMVGMAVLIIIIMGAKTVALFIQTPTTEVLKHSIIIFAILFVAWAVGALLEYFGIIPKEVIP